MVSQAADMTVTIASGDGLDIRELGVFEAMSTLFSITLTAVSDNADIDFESAVGKEAKLVLHGRVAGMTKARTWTGICNELHQVRVEESGLSTYRLRIVPTLWLTSQRRNHRMFQQMSELDIVLQLLAEWGIEPIKKTTAVYKKRKYKVQYGETDFAFISRMLEDIGVAFYFEEHDGETKLVLNDAPQSNDLRAPPIAFRDEPTSAADREHVTGLRVGRQVRPGKVTLRDHDYRRPPSYPLIASASAPNGIEEKLERFHYVPGAFLFESDKGEDTPHADDRGKHRTDDADGAALAQKRLDADRNDATSATFSANVIDLAPGVVTTLLDHPASAVSAGKRLLVVESEIHVTRGNPPSASVEVRSASHAYRPPIVTPRPTTNGVESATVVGPEGEEIHTDEFGRVRVQFHWDREGQMNELSSCWIHVSQPWGGSGFGGSSLPRIGQEVIVDFLGGDPDRPVIVGRVYTNLQKTPYKLPANKTQSGWKSNSSPTTGGYNEIMLEDLAGSELFRIQAEKDMHKLVKNNEDVTIGNNRTHHVVNNERQIVGQNRSVAIGVNRATQVGNICSTIVGNTHSVVVTPPGEAGPTAGTAQVITNDKITLSTPSGASIVLEGSKITLTADNIVLTGHKGVIQTAEAGDMVIKGAPKIKMNP